MSKFDVKTKWPPLLKKAPCICSYPTIISKFAYYNVNFNFQKHCFFGDASIFWYWPVYPNDVMTSYVTSSDVVFHFFYFFVANRR